MGATAPDTVWSGKWLASLLPALSGEIGDRAVEACNLFELKGFAGFEGNA
jgi:hypothetical protein